MRAGDVGEHLSRDRHLDHLERDVTAAPILIGFAPRPVSDHGSANQPAIRVTWRANNRGNRFWEQCEYGFASTVMSPVGGVGG